MNRPHRFHLRDSPTADLTRALIAIPGVRIFRSAAVAPENAAWIVEKELRRRAIAHRYEAPRIPEERLTALPLLPELRPWVPAFATSYQLFGATRFYDRDGLILYAPGAGKTLTAIMWALLKRGQCVFVTRASARRTIANEVKKYTTCTAQVILGTAPVLIDPTARFVILGWETLPAHVNALAKAGPTSVVYDECQKGRGRKRYDATPLADGTDVEALVAEKGGFVKRTKDGLMHFIALDNIAASAMKLSRAARRRLGATGTVISDRRRDLWGQLDLIAPGEFGRFVERDGDWVGGFTGRYLDGTVNTWGGVETKGKSNSDELTARLSFVVHHVSEKESHGELPPKRRQVIYLPVDEQDAPASMAKEIAAALRRGPTAVLEARLMEAASRKRHAVVQQVIDDLSAKYKVVIFTGRRKDCERLGDAVAKAVEREGIEGCKVWVTHGGFPPEDRDRTREEYMATPGPCILVATGDSMGEAISLDDTDTANMVMLPYTPGQLIQREGRFHRRSTKRHVLIRYFVAEGTVDEHVASILLEKLPDVADLSKDDTASGLATDLAGLGDEQGLIDSLLSKIVDGVGDAGSGGEELR